jgi:predicted nucleic acid-binding Zn ribbon protein
MWHAECSFCGSGYDGLDGTCSGREREGLQEDLNRARQRIKEQAHTIEVLHGRINTIRNSVGNIGLGDWYAIPVEARQILWNLITERS